MSTAGLNKVDMSLDDIIKINRAEKRQKAKSGAARGAKSARGQGGSSRGVGRGRGRGGVVATNGLRGKPRGGAVQGVRGAVYTPTRGRVNLNASTRGRGIRQPIYSTIKGLTGRGRGNITSRGGGRGRSQSARVAQGSRPGAQTGNGMQLFSKSGLSKQVASAAQEQNQRLNKARKQAALLREKQLALKNLQQAQKNMQTVTLAIQKSSRDSIINQMRGLGASGLPTASTSGRGRRKLLANLGRPGLNSANFNVNMNNGYNLSRQLNYTSVTISNPAAFNASQSQRGRRRPWRKPKAAPVADPFKIEVTNPSPLPQPKPQQSSVLEKLKSLKPAVPTTYKFQKNVFAAPTTGLSLSERFSGSSSSSSSANHLQERQVFV